MRVQIWCRAATVAVVVACVTPTGGCGCTPAAYTGYVVGFVQDGAGAPLSATVTASIRDRFCAATVPEVWGVDLGVTNVSGRYRLAVWAGAPDTVCVRLVARRTSAADSSVRDSVQLAITRGDTLRVDFSLP